MRSSLSPRVSSRKTELPDLNWSKLAPLHTIEFTLVEAPLLDTIKNTFYKLIYRRSKLYMCVFIFMYWHIFSLFDYFCWQNYCNSLQILWLLNYLLYELGIWHGDSSLCYLYIYDWHINQVCNVLLKFEILCL